MNIMQAPKTSTLVLLEGDFVRKVQFPAQFIGGRTENEVGSDSK